MRFLIVGLLMLAACGGSAPLSTPAPSPTTLANAYTEAQQKAYNTNLEFMRENLLLDSGLIDCDPLTWGDFLLDIGSPNKNISPLILFALSDACVEASELDVAFTPYYPGSPTPQ